MSDQPDPGLLEAEVRARREHAHGPFDAAVWSLVLGESEEGLERIRGYLAAPTEAEGGGVGWVKLAVLAGDWSAAAEAARSALPGLTYVAGYREYAAALLCLIAGEEDEARSHVEQLEEHAGTRAKLRSGHPATVSEIARGLLERDAARAAAGVEALLAWHLRRARARSEVFNSSRGVICLDAIVAVLLAHRRGLSVPVAAKYRSARLPLLVLYLTEWNGRPLPRAMPLAVQADLVAGSWLRSHGVAIEDVPFAPAATTGRARRSHSRGPAEVGEDFVRRSLRLREQEGGSAWQLASWALMLGDARRARGRLEREAAAARRRWRETAPEQGRGLRWLWQTQSLPNQHHIREHFVLALALGDEEGLAETTQLLQAWAQAVDDDRRRRGQPPYAEGRYGHADGYVDLLCAVLAGTPVTRAEAEQVTGPLSSTRVACVGLVERDPALLADGLDGMLGQHAEVIERRSSPPAPVCQPAALVAVAATRLGLAVAVDERFSNHLVPIEIRNLPNYVGRLGRLPCDLLGRALWQT